MTNEAARANVIDRQTICRERCQEWLSAILQYVQEQPTYGVSDRRYFLDGRWLTLKREEIHQMKSNKFRTLIDSWFAYHNHEINGLLKSTFTVQWLNKGDLANKKLKTGLLSLHPTHFISCDAWHVLEQETKEHLVKDHSIPVVVLETKLKQIAPRTIEEVETFLLTYYRLGIITKQEDNRTNLAKLRKNMPIEWNERNPFARYEYPFVTIERWTENNPRL